MNYLSDFTDVSSFQAFLSKTTTYYKTDQNEQNTARNIKLNNKSYNYDQLLSISNSLFSKIDKNDYLDLVDLKKCLQKIKKFNDVNWSWNIASMVKTLFRNIILDVKIIILKSHIANTPVEQLKKFLKTPKNKKSIKLIQNTYQSIIDNFSSKNSEELTPKNVNLIAKIHKKINGSEYKTDLSSFFNWYGKFHNYKTFIEKTSPRKIDSSVLPEKPETIQHWHRIRNLEYNFSPSLKA